MNLQPLNQSILLKDALVPFSAAVALRSHWPGCGVRSVPQAAAAWLSHRSVLYSWVASGCLSLWSWCRLKKGTPTHPLNPKEMGGISLKRQEAAILNCSFGRWEGSAGLALCWWHLCPQMCFLWSWERTEASSVLWLPPLANSWEKSGVPPLEYALSTSLVERRCTVRCVFTVVLRPFRLGVLCVCYFPLQKPCVCLTCLNVRDWNRARGVFARMKMKSSHVVVPSPSGKWFCLVCDFDWVFHYPNIATYQCFLRGPLKEQESVWVKNRNA